MNTIFTPRSLEEGSVLMWEVGSAHGITRSAIRARLGDPAFIETDSLRTFGGEEDWWSYHTFQDQVVAICFRVPYGDAVLFVSEPTESLIREASTLLAPWALDLYEKPIEA
jgi:hypothetical protein